MTRRRILQTPVLPLHVYHPVHAHTPPRTHAPSAIGSLRIPSLHPKTNKILIYRHFFPFPITILRLSLPNSTHYPELKLMHQSTVAALHKIPSHHRGLPATPTTLQRRTRMTSTDHPYSLSPHTRRIKPSHPP